MSDEDWGYVAGVLTFGWSISGSLTQHLSRWSLIGDLALAFAAGFATCLLARAIRRIVGGGTA